MEHYDNNYIRANSYDIKKDKEKVEVRGDVEFVTTIQGEIFLFSSVIDRKSTTKTLYYQKIDKRTLSPEEDLVKIAEIVGFDTKQFIPDYGYFGYSFSEDSSRFLIFHKLGIKESDNEEIICKVFDNNLKMLWEKRIELPYQEKLLDIIKVKIDSKGNVYLLSLACSKITIGFNRQLALSTTKVNPFYTIFGITEFGEAVREYKIIQPDKNFSNVQLDFDINGNIIFTAFFSDQLIDCITGVFYSSINGKTKEVTNSNLQYLKLDIFKPYDGLVKPYLKQKTDNLSFCKLKVENQFVRKDGSVIIVGEFYTVEVNGNSRRYFYQDLVVININSDGNVAWARLIPKTQASSNDLGFYASYAATLVADNLYLIFNDNIKSLNSLEIGKRYNGLDIKNGILVLVSVQPSGALSKEILSDSKTTKVRARPKVFKRTSEKELVLYGEYYTKKQFAKIKFI